jgi:hypothetical protein
MMTQSMSGAGFMESMCLLCVGMSIYAHVSDIHVWVYAHFKNIVAAWMLQLFCWKYSDLCTLGIYKTHLDLLLSNFQHMYTCMLNGECRGFESHLRQFVFSLNIHMYLLRIWFVLLSLFLSSVYICKCLSCTRKLRCMWSSGLTSACVCGGVLEYRHVHVCVTICVHMPRTSIAIETHPHPLSNPCSSMYSRL